MTTSITRAQTPEEAELERKKLELGALESELAERELDLSTVEAELRAFERRYLRTVGVKYAELDEIEAQIAEAEARLKPKNTTVKERASQARTQAEESAQAAGVAQESKGREDFKPPEDLKKLYREVARRIHPDLATDEKERSRRTHLMAEVNRAYQDSDAERLQAILREWESSPETVMGDGTGAELVRAIRKIAQVQGRMRAIEIMIMKQKESDLYKLMMKAREAEQQGRDLLKEMTAKLVEEIISAENRLTGLSSARVNP